jgi:hypothetical protein
VPALVERLRQAGATIREPIADGRALVAVPDGWLPREFFAAAAAAGVTLSHLKPEEEDLQQVFFRVTGAAGGAVQSGTPPVPATAGKPAG